MKNIANKRHQKLYQIKHLLQQNCYCKKKIPLNILNTIQYSASNKKKLILKNTSSI